MGHITIKTEHAGTALHIDAEVDDSHVHTVVAAAIERLHHVRAGVPADVEHTIEGTKPEPAASALATTSMVLLRKRVPTTDAMATWIRSQPNMSHSVTAAAIHFLGRAVHASSKVPGESAIFHALQRRTARARRQIKAEDGHGQFVTEHHGVGEQWTSKWVRE